MSKEGFRVKYLHLNNSSIYIISCYKNHRNIVYGQQKKRKMYLVNYCV